MGRRAVAAGAVVGAAVVLVAVGAVVAGRDRDGPAPVVAAPTTAHHEVSVGVLPERATLDVVGGVSSVLVRGGGSGVTASTPEGSRVVPVVSVDGGTVRVRVADAGGSGPAALTVVLGSGSRWDVRISGGADEATLDLGRASLGGVDFAAGIGRIEATLPRPEGVVPVRMAGGTSRLALHLPAGTAYGLRVGGGAGSVETDGLRRTGLAGGTTVATSTAADRYQVDATAGVSAVVLDRQ
jgi:hypothetical protein